ncbi:MAG: nicotinate phosphoribosyltransferase [Chlamydiales bacterium]
MSHSKPSRLYAESLSLLTDLYQMTMAYGYWKNQMVETEAIFHLFFRRPPFNGGFTIAAGLEQVIDYIQHFHFDETDLAYLETLKGGDDQPYFPTEFLDYLSKLRFEGDIDAVPEGTVVFPQEPLVRVKGPIIQCQILETPLLNLINFASLIATKSARVSLAAQGGEVLEFGLRRAQGIDGALTAARSAYIGGADATSNVLAGKLYGIPVKGTHSHSWVMAFEDEEESFRAFAKAMPNNCVFLVDTYDTIQGVKNAIKVGKWLEDQGKKMLGIRLDSGDLAYLSIESRRMLDEAGLDYAKIVASNELEEEVITDLKNQGAKIDIWGVGTNLITAKDQPALDGVYKLSAIREPGQEWSHRIKLSEQMRKVSNPGILQVRRFYDDQGCKADAIYNIQDTGKIANWEIIDPFDATRHKRIDPSWKHHDLLEPIFREGNCVYTSPSLKEIRQNTRNSLSSFHSGIKRFRNPHQYVVGMERNLYNKKIELIHELREE